ncbi:DNA-binding protein [Bacillus sp. M6-12]|uniref:helix-turn-helix domain-containing protein n=1 Tax=Bacillus sp. M6-12 TaxID=2054166 RepID=UPI000C75FB3C|nr:helix-turn-helix domain-containing protein [Bacillus sp. M6-12]PLS19425.1 DNA-binding protein [Bacillus sp. M6-12]
MANVWSCEENEFLLEHVGVLKVETIAKKLNRPVGGVLKQMRLLNISITRKQTGLLTMGELAKLLGVDRKTVENWCHNHDLSFTKKKTRQIKTYYFIDSLQFWQWAYEHQERVDFTKIEPNSIPPEPEWVDTLRFKKKKIKGNYYRPWTTKEEELVIQLREKGTNYQEIAKKINRTSMSVEKKYKRLVNETIQNIS